MKRKFLFVLLFFLIIIPVAAAGTLQDKALEYLEKACTGNEGGIPAVLCFQQSQIKELQAKVNELENKIDLLAITPTPSPTPTPEPFRSDKFIIYSTNGALVNEIIDVTGYSTITMVLDGYQSSAALFYSNDQVSWTVQGKFAEDAGPQSQYVYPILGKYYTVTTWSNWATTRFRYTLNR